jgi:hypothetical protein
LSRLEAQRYVGCWSHRSLCSRPTDLRCRETGREAREA